MLRSKLDKLKGNVIEVETAMSVLNLDRGEIIKLFQAAEQQGLGTFKVGRRNFKSRFLRGVQTNLDESFHAKPDENGAGERLETLAQTRGWVEHTFPIDANTDAKLRLPRDLTPSEADRVSRFVQSLAIAG